MKASVKQDVDQHWPLENLSLVDVNGRRLYNRKDVFLNSEKMKYFLFFKILSFKCRPSTTRKTSVWSTSTTDCFMVDVRLTFSSGPNTQLIFRNVLLLQKSGPVPLPTFSISLIKAETLISTRHLKIRETAAHLKIKIRATVTTTILPLPRQAARLL